jgi:hypothetical protein
MGGDDDSKTRIIADFLILMELYSKCRSDRWQKGQNVVVN